MHGAADERDWILDWAETILVYKLPQLSREEIKMILELQDAELKRSRFYQEVLAEGRGWTMAEAADILREVQGSGKGFLPFPRFPGKPHQVRYRLVRERGVLGGSLDVVGARVVDPVHHGVCVGHPRQRRGIVRTLRHRQPVLVVISRRSMVVRIHEARHYHINRQPGHQLPLISEIGVDLHRIDVVPLLVCLGHAGHLV